MAEFYAGVHRDHGVELRMGVEVAEITGKDHRSTGVRLEDGGVIDSDTIVVGVGITPNTELGESAGLTVDNGIVVDQFLATSDPDISAAGDAANTYYPLFDTHLRLEHWSAALNQGPVAAANMVGRVDPYDHVPYFFSDQYDVGMEYSGFVAGGHYDEVIFRGDMDKGEFVAFWIEGGQVRAGMNVNVWDVTDAIQGLVRSDEPVDRAKLADPEVPLEDAVGSTLGRGWLMTTEPFGEVRRLAAQLRVDSIRCSTEAGSGHPTSSLSAADLMAVLLVNHLRYDWDRPDLPSNDHLIFSKGHASPLLYSMFRAVGVVDDEELIKTYRQLGSRLGGHPTPALPWVDVATGSLGQGLPDAVGVCLAGRYLDELDYHVWVLCGDSETAEGSVWEALDKASYYKLGNLTAIVDVNRLGQRGPTELEWELDHYAARVDAFGCRSIVIDGHDLEAIDEALADACSDPGQPTVVLARTIKAKGVPELEDRNGWHGKALPADMAERAVAALGGPGDLRITTHRPASGTPAITPDPTASVVLPTYAVGDKVATRAAFGAALVALAARPELIVVDGEVGNSTHADEFQKVCPERYFEIFIAEQQLVATAVGLAVRGYVAFASTFAVFFSRAFDFIRMAGISEVNIRLVGTHAGVEIGEDGPSQMALEDLASLRAVYGSVILYPADAPSTVRLVARMADTPGIVYLRATRGAYPVIYAADDTFEVGGSKVHHFGEHEQVALIGAGVTLHECLAAAEVLKDSDISVRVIDVYSVKPIDRTALMEACQVTESHLVVVEDHYPQGGIGSAVLEALADAPVPPLKVAHLAVSGLPTSGTPAELLDAAGISSSHIVDAARRLVGF